MLPDGMDLPGDSRGRSHVRGLIRDVGDGADTEELVVRRAGSSAVFLS